MKNILIAASLLIMMVACNPKAKEENSISSDSVAIAAGKTIFTQNCTACHNFAEAGIGPRLGGVTKEVSVQWLKDFIKNPESVINSGDQRAKTLFEKYHTIMPSFTGSDSDVDNLVAYLNTLRAPRVEKPLDPNALKDPIPEPIPMSDLVVELEEFAVVPTSNPEKPLTRITKIGIQPETNELYVVDLRGKLYHLKGHQPEVYLDLEKLRPNFLQKPGHASGFGSFAFHPDFAKNGIFYTTHTENPGSGKADFTFPDSIKVMMQGVLTEWKAKDPKAIPFSGESREVFRVNMLSPIHGVQEITFNPLSKPGSEDYGMLYIGIGDGGSAENGYQFLCHNIEKIWGTVLRIDPLGTNAPNGKYGIPQGNPFVKLDNPRANKEVYAYGFRNPHRITWSKAGDMLVVNVGHHNIEALYIVKPGNDCGWPMREGTFVIDPSQNMHNIYPRPADDDKNSITYPVAQYDHDEGDAISGGMEYWGNKIPKLKGKFFFGDIVRGRLFYVEMKDLKVGQPAPIKEWRISINGEIKTLRELTGVDKVDERFGRDAAGELYITTKPDGKIYKLKAGRESRTKE